MQRLHSTLIALVIAAAAATGLFAAVRTVRLGQTAATAQPAAIPTRELALRRAKLTRWNASLHKALAKRPPALPKLPHYAPVTIPAAPPPAAVAAAAGTLPAASQAPVKYVQARPVVKYKHSSAPATTTTSSSSVSGGEGSDDGAGGGDGSGGGVDN